MKQTFSLITASILALALAFAAMVPAAPPINTVELPILVYAEDGGSAHTETDTLYASNGSAGTSLYVQAHQPFYHRTNTASGVEDSVAAEVSVNGGPAIAIDSLTTCAEPEESWGCVSGAFSTIRMELPAMGFVDGANTIQFRFNGTDGIRSGYRVLGVDILDADSTSLVDGTDFIYTGDQVDPAPEGYDNAQDIAAGDSLWHNAELVESAMEGANSIGATCSGCHAEDGRDLQYFNYENETVYARGRFHGLSHDEATQIVAYIRSIQIEESDGTRVDPPGAPWDPPYQPGPIYKGSGAHPDSSDQVYWAAGAGLESVLEQDGDMKPWLFPEGGLADATMENPPAVDYADYYEGDGVQDLNWQHANFESTLNMRAVPMAIQMPDWNNWLPDVHPADGYGASADGLLAYYENELLADQEEYLALENPTAEQQATAADRLGNQIGDLNALATNRSRGGYTPFGRNVDFNSTVTYDQMLEQMSYFQWKAVKAWQAHHTMQLEDVADETYGADWWSEPLGWLGSDRTVFDLGPHISALKDYRWHTPPNIYGSPELDGQLTHIWYHLQLVLNPGTSRGISGQAPVDWNYQTQFLPKSLVPSAWRQLQSDIKMMQMVGRGNFIGQDPDGSSQYGFNAHEKSPAIPYKYLRDGQIDEHLSNLSETEARQWMDVWMRAWNHRVVGTDTAGIGRSDRATWWNSASNVPAADYPFECGYNFEDCMYSYTPDLVASGRLSPSLGDSLTTWTDTMWPLAEDPTWEDLITPEDYTYDNTITPRSLRAAPYVNTSGALTNSNVSGGEAAGRRFTQQGFTGLRQCGALPCEMTVRISAVEGPRPQTVSPVGAWTTTTVQGPPGFWAEVERFGREAESARVRVYHRSVPDALPQRLATTYVSTEDDVQLRFRFAEGESSVSALRSSGWELVASAPLELADVLDDRPYLGVGIWSRDANASASVTITNLATIP